MIFSTARQEIVGRKIWNPSGCAANSTGFALTAALSYKDFLWWLLQVSWM
jgi:hypothetical protein